MLSDKIVYVMTAKFYYVSHEYEETKNYLSSKFPSSTFLYPDLLYFDNKHWLETVSEHLHKADRGLIIPATNGLVGYGVCSEIQAFKDVNKQVYCLNHNNITTDFNIKVVNERDWKRYAMVVIKDELKDFFEQASIL